VDSAIRVHRELGPGLLESAYEICLEYELVSRGLSVRRQVGLPLTYRGVKLDAGYRIDLLVDDRIILEIKAVEALTPVHEAQLLTYLKLSELRLGFLMNFHTALMKQGLERMVL
jgi:GxxExxY protein